MTIINHKCMNAMILISNHKTSTVVIRYIDMRYLTLLLLSIVTLNGCTQISSDQSVQIESEANDTTEKVVKTEQEWKSVLSDEEFYILRMKGTEKPYSGEYVHHHEEGVYHCAACNAALFRSDTKFDVCGWPSFFDPVNESAITYAKDESHGMIRTEVMCSRCGGHLGHVFDDGPKPTGLRYCINSISLDFVPDDSTSAH